MKKLLLGLTLLFGVLGFTQTLTYDQLSNSKERIKGGFTEYIAKDGSIYKVNDTLTIGMPSSNKTFAFISIGDGVFTPLQYVGINVVNTKTVIKSIGIVGTKRSGFKVVIKGKGMVGFGDNYNIHLENSIESGEIKSFGMTSDEALSELKKAKDKLDLGLITKEEFEAKRLEFSKYIK